MKRSSFVFFFLACSAIFFLSCNNNGESTSATSSTTKKAAPVSGTVNYQLLADAYCKCSEPTVAINNEMEKLMSAQDNAAFDKLVPEADKAFKKALNCCREAKAEQTTGEVDQKVFIRVLKSTCPNLPGQLVLKMVTEIK